MEPCGTEALMGLLYDEEQRYGTFDVTQSEHLKTSQIDRYLTDM